MDYVFVLDVSGSMGDDDKLDVSRDSVAAFLRALGAEGPLRGDGLQHPGARPPSAGSRPATAEALARARTFLGAQQAQGGTSLLPALTQAYTLCRGPAAQRGRPERRAHRAGGAPAAARRASPRGPRARASSASASATTSTGRCSSSWPRRAAAWPPSSRAGTTSSARRRLFRGKLARPEATDLAFRFSGVEVFDVEPQRLPSLYAGSPLRVYGRYRGGGRSRCRSRASAAGRRSSRRRRSCFPEKDKAHPEIERMWAWRRVQRLLKEADRSGLARGGLAEIVRLGEAFSIATEYTSFLVLENDAEYQRWKIERRNALLMARDQRRSRSGAPRSRQLRQKTVSGLGPEAIASPKAPPLSAPAGQPLASSPSRPPPRRSRSRATTVAAPTCRGARAPWGRCSRRRPSGWRGGGAVPPRVVPSRSRAPGVRSAGGPPHPARSRCVRRARPEVVMCRLARSWDIVLFSAVLLVASVPLALWGAPPLRFAYSPMAVAARRVVAAAQPSLRARQPLSPAARRRRRRLSAPRPRRPQGERPRAARRGLGARRAWLRRRCSPARRRATASVASRVSATG